MAALEPRLFGCGSVSQLAEGESYLHSTVEPVSSKLVEPPHNSWGFVGYWSGYAVQ